MASTQTATLLKNPTTQTLLTHLDQPIQGYKQLFQCSKCGAKFKTAGQMEEHFERKHKSANPIYERMIVSGNYIQSRLDGCKTQTIVLGHRSGDVDCQHKRYIQNSCYIRMCPKCEGTRRSRYSRKYQNAILDFKRVSVLTLTYKGYHPLNSKTKRDLELKVRNFMKRLQRRLNYEIQYVRVLEIVHKPSGYYYHYHFLIDIPFVKQKTLSKTWGETSGGSFVVWIEALKDENSRPVGIFWNRLPKKQKQKNCVSYVTKYLAKPLSDIGLDKYARYVYSNHFVETRLTCIKGQNSSKNYPKCPACGDRIFYLEIIEGEPPPPT